jgi:A/G-specific adenine glycosylase
VIADPDLPAAREALLAWYREHRRDLPWRRTRDPYAIWVSEVMLQQTQVAAVVPHYHRFLERFPSPAALAAASEDAVLAAWSGLGYYGRARRLRHAAREVVARHGGSLPRDPAALRALPGIGRYSAGAIASVAFDLPEPIVDGNVRRVLLRVGALAVSPSEERRALWDTAQRLVRGPHPGDLNQALMELGALVCTPRAPRCLACPLARWCRARATGRPEDYPAPSPPRPTRRIGVAVAVIRRGARVLLEAGGGGSPLRGRWDLPAFEVEPGRGAGETIEEGMRARHGLEVRVQGAVGRAAHSILDRRLALQALACVRTGGRVAGRATLRWVPLAELPLTPVSGATTKLLHMVVPRLLKGAADMESLGL